MNIEYVRTDDALLITPSFDRLDATNALRFKEDCAARRAGASKLIIDLSPIKFIDSAGLGALVALFKHLGEGGQISLVAPNRAIRMLIEMTRLDSIFRMVDTVDAARP